MSEFPPHSTDGTHPERLWVALHTHRRGSDLMIPSTAPLGTHHPYPEREYVRADVADALVHGVEHQALELGHQLVKERKAVERDRDRYRDALIEAAAAAREIPNVVIGSDCDDHDAALRAVGWAATAADAAERALDATHPTIDAQEG